MHSELLTFPKDFVWGTATAVTKIEGGLRKEAARHQLGYVSVILPVWS